MNECELTAGNIKQAILEHHDTQLLEDICNSKKMKKHKEEDFTKVQSYMEGKVLSNCRMAFRIRCEMVCEVKGNCKDKYRRKGGEEALNCEDCQSDVIQTQAHCLTCPHWEDIRRGLELEKLEGMVTFFQRMLQERLREKTGS